MWEKESLNNFQFEPELSPATNFMHGHFRGFQAGVEVLRAQLLSIVDENMIYDGMFIKTIIKNMGVAEIE